MKPASVDSSPNCIATPNYAGFVPSLKHQYGLTYGNATRHILRTDPTIKSGVIQTEIEKRKDVFRRCGTTNVNVRDLATTGGPKKGDGTSVKRTGGGHSANYSYANGSGNLDADGAVVSARPSSHDVPEKWKGEGEDGAKWLWTTAKKYATGDDRFSFPPVPGYTGYIPRSQEHFGRPYVETTHASLSDFQNMLRTKATLPPRVQAIQDRAPQSSINRLSNSPYNPSASKKQPSQRNVPHGGGFAGGNASGAAGAAPVPPPPGTRPGKITSSSPIDDMSPYRLPQNHPHKTFISGYTGFVPRLQNHFGEPYSDNVREALDEFTAPRPPHDPYRYIREQSTGMSVTSYSSPKNTVKVNLGKAKPIPGFTGFIPGSRTHYSSTFGRTAEAAYEQFNNNRGGPRYAQSQTPDFAPKDLAESEPIPGYRGHIPTFIFHGDRPYGISSKACIQDFDRERTRYRNEQQTYAAQESHERMRRGVPVL